MKSRPCPCGSGSSTPTCCARFFDGAEPPDVVTLMRSRYAAFALGEVEYLWRTLHSSHVDRSKPRDDVLRALRDTCRTVRFLGLRVLDHDDTRVLFSVRAFEKGREVSFHERSRFRKDDDGGWRYVDGDTFAGEAPEGMTIKPR